MEYTIGCKNECGSRSNYSRGFLNSLEGQVYGLSSINGYGKTPACFPYRLAEYSSGSAGSGQY
jgi:hypothetical protein